VVEYGGCGLLVSLVRQGGSHTAPAMVCNRFENVGMADRSGKVCLKKAQWPHLKRLGVKNG
jgi:hypothetical protein